MLASGRLKNPWGGLARPRMDPEVHCNCVSVLERELEPDCDRKGERSGARSNPEMNSATTV